MQYIDNIVFFIALVIGFGLFFKSFKEIYRNINLGKKIDRTDQPAVRWKTMGKVALGQSKMVKRPIAGFLHILVYVGFVIINLISAVTESKLLNCPLGFKFANQVFGNAKIICKCLE